MSLDLSQFHDAFFEESFEALDSMEASLLKLDVGAPDPEIINTIFRVAHSIKGGSATFGFGDIASFTHSLETLLDELRGGRMSVSVAISDLLLKSVDVMREMLRAVQGKLPIDAQRVADLQFDLELAIARKTDAPAEPSPAGAVWRIGFRPYPQFFARGNDPLRMLRELAALGRIEVSTDPAELPALTELDPQACYLGWTIELTGDVTEAAIRDVFDWATGECDLSIERAGPAAIPAAEPPAVEAPAAAPDEPEPAAPGPEHASLAAEVVALDPASRPAAAQPAAGRADTPNVSGIGDSGSIRVSVEKIDELMNTVGELVITQAMLSQLSRNLEGPAAEQFRSGLAQLERNMRELQESVMRVRMLPISFVFSRFPRMVRDLAQRLGKQIELKLTGEHTELDKTVLEKIGDPLVHLVRNSIDHGIEKPAVRSAAGKPAAGTVHLDACHRGGNIAVEVSDDGGGLDKDRILAKARERGLVGPNDPMTDEQIYDLIFLPGFSTAEQTTDVSGRGVGMDVVRRNIKELGGKIEVRTERGRGSRFIITLPLTLAIVDGQSVAVGTETYIVPLTSIIESLQLKPEHINRLSGRGEVFAFRGHYLPVIRLHEIFGVEPRARELHEGLVVVVEGDGRRYGLFVDDLLGQQQVVIKSLETNYGNVEGVSGATILGDGSVALILDLPGLIRVTTMRAAA
jgi:two-component system, chemotaxis family, sensor kinase CheA